MRNIVSQVVQQKKIQRAKQVIRLIGRIKSANLMELSEKEFGDFVREVKTSQLFKKLIQSKDGKVIKLQHSPRTRLPSDFYELKEEFLSDRSTLNIESFLNGKGKIVQIIRNLGNDKFKRYFLNENSVSDSEIVSQCDLSMEETEKIRELVDELLIQTEFFQYPNPTENKIGGIYYTKVASIIKEKGKYTIRYLNFNLYGGRYIIDYKKIGQLKKQNYFTETEIAELSKLLQNLELINNRKQVIHSILEGIIEYQNSYLDSGDPLDLKPLSQRELGRKTGISPSHICRVIRYKTMEMPWEEERKISFFFPNRKAVVKRHMEKILKEQKNNISDQKLKLELERRLNFSISRRSITMYRNELKVPSSYKRGS